jgi:hypothetical protein
LCLVYKKKLEEEQWLSMGRDLAEKINCKVGVHLSFQQPPSLGLEPAVFLSLIVAFLRLLVLPPPIFLVFSGFGFGLWSAWSMPHLERVLMRWTRDPKQVVIRTKGKRFVPGEDHLIQRYEVDGKTYPQWVTENRFSQSNSHICQAMLTWAHKQMAKEGGGQHSHDLIELYCGNGNFTLPLSALFRRVFATELDKYSVKWVVSVPKRTPESTVAQVVVSIHFFHGLEWEAKAKGGILACVFDAREKGPFSMRLFMPLPAKWKSSLITPTEKCRCLVPFPSAGLQLRAQRKRASATYA